MGQICRIKCYVGRKINDQCAPPIVSRDDILHIYFTVGTYSSFGLMAFLFAFFCVYFYVAYIYYLYMNIFACSNFRRSTFTRSGYFQTTLLVSVFPRQK